jgi:hypothetical protein
LCRIFHLEHRGCSSTLEVFDGKRREHRGKSNARPNNDHIGLAAALITYITRQDEGVIGRDTLDIPGEDLLHYEYPRECYL